MKRCWKPATHLSWNTVKQPWNMKKWKVCRVYPVHFTEHLFHISYFTPFCSRWRFFDETSKISYLILCKSALIHSLESTFHENGEKWVKECFTFHFFSETPWNSTIWNIKYDRRATGKEHLFSHFIFHVVSLDMAVFWWNIKGFLQRIKFSWKWWEGWKGCLHISHSFSRNT